MEARTRKKGVFGLVVQPQQLENHELLEKLTSKDRPEGVRTHSEGEGSFKHQVSGRETLATIAAANDTTVSDLMRENKFMSSLVYPGQLIKLPKKKSTDNLTAPTTPTTPPSSPTATTTATSGNVHRRPLTDESGAKKMNSASSSSSSSSSFFVARQRSVSEYCAPASHLLTIPSAVAEKANKTPTKSRKISVADALRNILMPPWPSTHNVSSRGRTRAISVVVPPKLDRERKLSVPEKYRRPKVEIQRETPLDVSPFPCEIIHPYEEVSVGCMHLSGKRMVFESNCQAECIHYEHQQQQQQQQRQQQQQQQQRHHLHHPPKYVYYSVEYDDLLTIGLYTRQDTGTESIDFAASDQFELAKVTRHPPNNKDHTGTARTNPSFAAGENECYLKVQLSPCSPFHGLNGRTSSSSSSSSSSSFFLSSSSSSSCLWFSIPFEKSSEVNDHLTAALPHSYSNLHEETRKDLPYDLHVKLLRGRKYVNASEVKIKFRLEGDTIYKGSSSWTTTGSAPSSVDHVWSEDFVVENVLLRDVITVLVKLDQSCTCPTDLPVSSLAFKVKQKLDLDLRGNGGAGVPDRLYSVSLEYLLLPEGSTSSRLPHVSYPLLHPDSCILSPFHVAKLVDNLPPLKTSSQRWSIVYSNDLHGSSLLSLYAKMAECCQEGEDGIVLVVRDANDKVFGAYLSTPLKRRRLCYGNGECFLFTFHPLFQKFAWSEANQNIIRSDNHGIAIGSDKHGDGLWIDEGIRMGRSDACVTFNNPPLVSHRAFDIVSLETWKIEV